MHSELRERGFLQFKTDHYMVINFGLNPNNTHFFGTNRWYPFKIGNNSQKKTKATSFASVQNLVKTDIYKSNINANKNKK